MIKETAMKILALVMLITGGTYAAELFVAPDGRDDNPGTRSQPLKTLEAARDAARKLPGEKTIFVRGGLYELERTLKLDAKDSGTTWRAYQNEKPVVIGGRQITGFTAYKGSILKATGIKGVNFRQLFFDGQSVYILDDGQAARHIQAHRGLIQQQQRRFMQQCPGNLYASPMPAIELAYFFKTAIKHV